MSDQETIPTQPRRKRGFFFWVSRVIACLVLFWVAIILLVHLPPVQKIIIKKVEKALARTLNTRAEIGSFVLHPISELTLKDIYIGSPESPNDTMISAELLRVNYNRIFDVFNKQLHITYVDIRKGDVFIVKHVGDSLNNLDEALSRILPPKKPNSADFILKLDGVQANELNIKVIDDPAGLSLQFFLNKTDVNVRKIDIPGKFIDIDDADIDDPEISVYIKEPQRNDSLYQSPEIPDSSIVSWKFNVGRLRFRDGKFVMRNATARQDTFLLPQSIDFANIELDEVDIQVDDFKSNGWNYAGANPKLHIRHANGFEIEDLSAKYADISSNGVTVEDLHLKTERSLIRNSFGFSFDKYNDFARFSHKVRVSVPDADIRLYVGDLLVIAPVLQQQDLLVHNQDETLTFNGSVNGILNDMSVRGMNMGLGGLSIHGDMHTYNLTVSGQERIKLSVKNSFITAEKLVNVIPQVKLPDFAQRLGQVRFVGEFDGHPKDFLAAGNFTTDLGTIGINLDMNLLNTISGGDFKGNVSTSNFDLGTLLSFPQLGRITMAGYVNEGYRIGQANMFADISGQIDSVQFNGHTYRKATVDGVIEKQSFNGIFEIEDSKIDLKMEGSLDYSSSDLRLGLVTNLKHVSLDKLGFVKLPMALSGDFELNGIVGNPDVIEGDFKGSHIILNRQDTIYAIDTLHLLATIDSQDMHRSYHLFTPIVEAAISGYFRPTTVVNHAWHYLHNHYPKTISSPDTVTLHDFNDSLSWKINIVDTKNWLDLLPVKDLVIVRAKTDGMLNLKDGEINGNVSLPEVHWKNINVYGSDIRFSEKSGRVDYNLEIIAADLREGLFFEEVYFKGDLNDDKINVNVRTDHLAEVIDELDLDITADPEGGSWTFVLTPRNLEMLGKQWQIPAYNKIEIHKDYFRLDSFDLISDSQRVSLQDINGKGLQAYLSGFEMASLNAFLNTDKFEFSGTYILNAEVDNIYDIKELKADLTVPDFQVNDEDYGLLKLAAEMDDPNDSVKIILDLVHNESALKATGTYLPPLKSVPSESHNYLRLHIDANDFPLDFLEFLIGSNIRDTEGALDLSLDLKGKINKLDPIGSGKVYSGSTTIDFLGVHYSFHEQSFKITPTKIDFTDVILYDLQGNTAKVTGGITHRHFNNLGLNLTIKSDKIQALDLNEGENDNFYGSAIGSLDAVFSGTIANPSIDIKTTTMLGTHIYIPLSGAREDLNDDFVIFLENGELPTAYKPTVRRNTIDLKMAIKATDDATVEIVFDENTGEVLRGNGEGDLVLTMDRNGTLGMTGDYRINRGFYLFTNFKIVRKSFNIKENSHISWNGDPYEAQLNVRATYTDLRATLYPLIQEYLEGTPNSPVANQAKELTQVDLEVILQGSLLHPDISFNIDFPEISGELRAFAESKISALKANQNAMNQQVIGLLMGRSFLPSSTAFGSGLLSKGINNTLSELISSTLSSYLGGLLASVLPKNKTITSVDFDVNVALPVTQGNTDLTDPDDNAFSQRYGVKLPVEFFNRLRVQVGADYVNGSNITAVNNYWAGDVEFEYKLTKDGRLSIRAYNRSYYSIEGRKNKTAIGFRVRKEFTSFRDIFKRKNRQVENVPEEESAN